MSVMKMFLESSQSSGWTNSISNESWTRSSKSSQSSNLRFLQHSHSHLFPLPFKKGQNHPPQKETVAELTNLAQVA